MMDFNKFKVKGFVIKYRLFVIRNKIRRFLDLAALCPYSMEGRIFPFLCQTRRKLSSMHFDYKTWM